MAKPLSNDVRKIIIKHMEAEKTLQEVADILGISVNAVHTIWRKYQATGSYEPYPPNGGRKPTLTAAQMEEVLNKIAEQPGITLEGLIATLNLPIKKSALSKRIIGAGYAFKKSSSSRAQAT